MAKERVKQKEKVHVTVRKVDTIKPRRNFLKYYKVVRYWAEQKYNLNKHDLEMLYFLLDENLFTQTDFKRYDKIFEWERNRFFRLLREGWIVKWRKEGEDNNRWAIYKLSSKAITLVGTIYKMLQGEVDFSLDPRTNPVMRKDVGYVAKTMKEEMIYINNENRKSRLKAVRMLREDIEE